MIEIAREKLTCEGGGYTTRKDKIETVFSKKYYAHIFPETRPQESNIYLPRILHIFFILLMTSYFSVCTEHMINRSNPVPCPLNLKF